MRKKICKTISCEKKSHARGYCFSCYQRKFLRRTAVYFQLKLGSIEIIVKRRFKTYADYMRWYQRKHSSRINAQRRLRHKNDINYYKCKHCKKTFKRASDKQWIKSWCEEAQKDVHLIRQ